MVAKSSITSLILTSFFSSTLASSCKDKAFCTGFGIDKLCKNSLFGAQMTKFCPETCKVPSCQQSIVLTENDNELTDEIPGCEKPGMIKMCEVAEHDEFMGKFCAKTCAEKSRDNEHSARPSSFKMVKSSCTDRSSKCSGKKMMCKMPSTQAFMESVCKNTCGKCWDWTWIVQNEIIRENFQ